MNYRYNEGLVRQNQNLLLEILFRRSLKVSCAIYNYYYS